MSPEKEKMSGFIGRVQRNHLEPPGASRGESGSQALRGAETKRRASPMRQQQETNIQGGDRMRQMELSAQTRDSEQQRKWLLEKRKPESLKLF